MSPVFEAKASAPGKAIIFGEHAVVYGVNAIAAALSDLRIIVDIEVVEGEETIQVAFKDIVDGENGPVTATISIERALQLVSHPRDGRDPLIAITPTAETTAALANEFSSYPFAAGQCMMAISYLFSGIVSIAWNNVCNGKSLGVKMQVQSAGLPIGAGLGSSAAFSVATAGAFLQLHFKMTERNQSWGSERLNNAVLESINAWAFVGEVLIHGTPSGLDNTTSCYGGMVKFRRTEQGNVFDTLKHAPTLNMLLTNTKVPRSTKALVAGVRVLHDAMPNVIQPIFASIDHITSEFIDIAEKLNSGVLNTREVKEKVDTLIKINHSLLDAIGVGHLALTEVVTASCSLGFTSKLTGAGGGGCAITLLDAEPVLSVDPEKLTQLSDLIRSKGFEVFSTAMGGDGVRWF